MIIKFGLSAAFVSGILSMGLSASSFADEVVGASNTESVRPTITVEQTSVDRMNKVGREHQRKAQSQAVVFELALSRKDIIKDLNMRLAEVQRDS